MKPVVPYGPDEVDACDGQECDGMFYFDDAETVLVSMGFLLSLRI